MKAKAIKIEFDKEDDWWMVQCSDGIELEEAVRMVREAWADHKKPKEPLIKDEKIRKEVRLFSVIWKVEQVKIDSNSYSLISKIEALGKGCRIEVPNININGVFSITELCGEEEE